MAEAGTTRTFRVRLFVRALKPLLPVAALTIGIMFLAPRPSERGAAVTLAAPVPLFTAAAAAANPRSQQRVSRDNWKLP